MSSHRQLISDTFRGCAPLVLGFFLAMLACLLINLCSCRTQEKVQVVEVPKVVTQTAVEHRLDIVRDTILRSDSVIIIQRGDTLIERSVTNVTNINRWLVTDTIHDTISVHDTQVVEVPIEVTKEVTKPPNVIDRISVWLGRLFLLALVAFCGWEAFRLYRKFK
mgnify:CR=1 FL=1